MKDAPSTGTDGELPTGYEDAIFWHYNLAGAANKAAAIAQAIMATGRCSPGAAGF